MTVATTTVSSPRGSGAGALPAGGITIRNFLLVAIQLGLVLILMRQFQIESAAFLRLSAFAFAAFAVHAFLPLPYRLPFFALASLVGIGLVMGVENGVWLVGIGLVLIGICHLPFSFWVRGCVLLAVGAVLALQRAHLMPFPWSEAIWPILGSMFMFRLMVYFYDLRHDTSRVSPSQSLAYFFMLPNACFPLFPVIDSKTFRRNHYDDDAYRIYQVGIDWMVRGVIHLILYRFVYYYAVLAPSEVVGPAELLRFLIANFLLYLRVSGLFHLVVGMLHLFGFRLPETHNRYLLASSFTDFWRRINIYWKDFMQKVFYYPAVFKLRSLGATRAIVLATLFVFGMTWVLHAYQWFWLRGTMLLAWQDGLFWLILGVLVVANSVYELKYGRQRSLSKPVWTWRATATLTLKTFATFWAICILWSLWTSESLSQWLSLWSALGGRYTAEVLVYPATVLVVILLGSIPGETLRNVRGSRQEERAWLQARLATVVAMVALIGVSVERVHSELGGETATLIHTLRSGRLSRLDTAQLEKGYYQSLLSVNRFNSQLWEVYTKKPANWLDVKGANLKRFVGGFVGGELIPSFVSNTNYGPISINRWGMRDKDYELKPPPGTFRVALLGASSVMGWGVPDGATFEALIETRLNRERSQPERRQFEILNLAVPGYQPPQQMVQLDKALRFSPNAIWYVAAGREIARATEFLVEVARGGIAIPYEDLRKIVAKAGLVAGMDEATALKRLTPHRDEVLTVVYSYVVQQSRARGAVPVFIFLPQVREGSWQEETAPTLKIAEAAGFSVIDLEDVYKDHDIAEIRLAEWDDHPNVRGHELIAERLYAQISQNYDKLLPGTQTSNVSR